MANRSKLYQELPESRPALHLVYNKIMNAPGPNELANYKYLVRVIWDALARKSSNCDCCDDVILIKIQLERLADELNIKIKFESRGN